MNALVKTLVVLAFVTLTTQTARHAYLLWLEPRGSALDRYEPEAGSIASAASLDDLLRRYELVHKKADQVRENQLKNEGRLAAVGDSDVLKSEIDLSRAIREWEQKSKEIREIRFFWAVGLALLVLGVVLFRKQFRWIGLMLWIAAFSEFIYWTSPTFVGSTREVDRLLANKLLFTVLSLGLLLLMIGFGKAFAGLGRESRAASPFSAPPAP